MKPHDAYLELAAVAIDFPLAPVERTRLERHLAGCAVCARAVTGFRADSVAVASTPVPSLTERRESEILSALMHPASLRNPLRLALLLALLALLAIGSLVAGGRLLLDMEQNPLVIVAPLSTADASPGATAPTAREPVAGEPSSASLGVLAVTHGDGTGSTWVELVRLDTGAVWPLGRGKDPAWVADNPLAYTCAPQGGDPTTICTLDTTAPEPIPEIAVDARRPAPAPDGSHLAIARGTVDVGETWLMQPDGSDLHRLAGGSFLQWSPDGIWLLGQPESAAFEVAVVRADGSDGGPQVLAAGYDPTWSPGGDRIAYVVVDGQEVKLRVMTPFSDVSETRFSVPAASELTAPAWLPDGRIVFVLDGDLYRLDVGSNEPVRLTTGLAIRADWFGDTLDVSPDSRSIAFSSGGGATARIGIASVDGGYRWLELGSGPVSQPRWAPATTQALDARFVGPYLALGPTGGASPAAPTGPAASSGSPPAIALLAGPATLACDAIGLKYGSLTWRIDPAVDPQVTAQTDTGDTLRTYWAPGFTAGTADERVIRDPRGQVVARDGDGLRVGDRLGGYFVCLGPQRLYVLTQDPP